MAINCEGTTVKITVDAVDPAMGVEWTISSGGYSEASSSSPFDMIGFAFILIFPILMTSLAFEEINEETFEDGAGLMLFPFLNAEENTWKFFSDLAEESSESGTASAGMEMVLKAKYQESDGDVLFEWYLTGSLETSSDGEEIDAEFEQHYLCSYVKATGVLNGHHMKGFFDGEVNTETVKFEYEEHVELVGFNLPNFEFGGGLLPSGLIAGFTALIALGAFVAIPILIKKRK